MNEVAIQKVEVPAMTDEQIAKVFELEKVMAQLPQSHLETHHLIHAGMYARTVYVPAGSMFTSVVVKVPTVLTVCGDCTVYLGGSTLRVTGYNVFPAAANRKQAYLAHGDTAITMTFATKAMTIEEIELESVDDPSLLAAARGGKDHVLITEG